ncbi:DNA-directed RNA polymerase subunit RPC12/RpoP [Deinobacterium chartae]|uniref:DNA-directed RNA polymerase subunit RPC12/RpoP n=1 Tax=Deinobacterium chartae TaxID=521158 RepID=A0A841I200_9DEIO|nr:hypothetical protein [Deinobacterium chartae]MBB6099086.1 DNA-directed RNA polymerase subunit RPC12/RpoP [Deinobacterium chartae]
MRHLTQNCPVCGADLVFTARDLEELQPGDIIACNDCGSDLEVDYDGDDLILTEHVYLTACPRCGNEFELTPEMLEHNQATCPHCSHAFELEWED